MRQPHPIFLLWPGLSGLIRYGRAGFLVIALGFAVTTDMTLFCAGFWTEWLTRAAKLYLCGALAVVWAILTAAAARLSFYFDRQLAYDLAGDRFLRLLDDYLAGHWPEAERIAGILLKRNRRDPETLLLLATLQRHTGRLIEAGQTLERLERLQDAEMWAFEINAEKQSLADAIRDSDQENAINAEKCEKLPVELEESAENLSNEPEETLLPFPGSEEYQGGRRGSNPRPSEPQSDALAN